MSRQQKSLTVEATVQNIEKVLGFIDEQLELCECPMRTQTQIDVAIDELFGNIALYAYAPNVGNATVLFDVEDNPKTAVITFIDSGVPYNPLEKEDPDITLSVEDRQIGGLGIFMVKKTMDAMQYEYRDGQNILSIRKKI